MVSQAAAAAPGTTPMAGEAPEGERLSRLIVMRTFLRERVGFHHLMQAQIKNPESQAPFEAHAEG